MLWMGKSTISMAIFNSYVCLPEGTGLFAGLFSRLWARNLTIFSDHLPRFTNPVKNTILWGQIPLTVGIEIYHPVLFNGRFIFFTGNSLMRQNSGMDRPAVIQTYGSVWITSVFVWIGGMDRPVGSGYGWGCTFWLAATMRGPQDSVLLV